MRAKLFIVASLSSLLNTPALAVPLEDIYPTVLTLQQSTLTMPENTNQAACEPLNPNANSSTLVGQLWRGNCDMVAKFLNNNFSVTASLVSDSATDDAFRYYSIQDYYYLLQTVLHRAYVLETYLPSPEPDTLATTNSTVNSMSGDISYATDFRQSLITDLGISDSVISNGKFHAAGLGYVKWLQSNTDLGWFAFQVSRIACIYGWGELANTLKNSQATLNNTLFFSEWISPNSDWTYGNNMINRLQAQVGLYNNTETFAAYNTLFRQGMAFEIAFFESALGKHPNDSLV